MVPSCVAALLLLAFQWPECESHCVTLCHTVSHVLAGSARSGVVIIRSRDANKVQQPYCALPLPSNGQAQQWMLRRWLKIENWCYLGCRNVCRS